MHTRQKKLADAVCKANFYRIHGDAMYDESFWERLALAPLRAGAQQMLNTVARSVARIRNTMRTRSVELGWYLLDERYSMTEERAQMLELRELVLHRYLHQMGLVEWGYLKECRTRARKRVYYEHWADIRSRGW